MQGILVSSKSESDKDGDEKLYLIPEDQYQYLYPRYYLSYEKMQKDMDNDKNKMKKRVTNYYHSKTIDRWLYHDYGFKELTGYFKIKYDNKGISVSLDLKDNHESKKFSHNEEKSILFFIESFMISKKFIKNILEEYARRTSSEFYELYSYEQNIKEFIRHQLKKKIRDTIKKLQ